MYHSRMKRKYHDNDPTDQKSISLEAALPHETPWSAGTSAGDVDDDVDEVDEADADARGLLFGVDGPERETPSRNGESDRWIFDGV